MPPATLATAVVVARGGSTRLPNKAMLPFAGATLIGHKVRTLRQCRRVGRVVVGSDSAAILHEAARHGADVVRRDDFHCDERACSANEMIRDMVWRVDGIGDDGVAMWAHPTNPLVTAETYGRAIDAYAEAVASGAGDSLVSVTEMRRHAWWGGRPLNYDPWSPTHVTAAGLAPVAFQDGAIFVQTRARFLETSYFFGSNPVAFPVDWAEGCDVDTADDLALARWLWFKRARSEAGAA